MILSIPLSLARRNLDHLPFSIIPCPNAEAHCERDTFTVMNAIQRRCEWQRQTAVCGHGQDLETVILITRLLMVGDDGKSPLTVLYPLFAVARSALGTSESKLIRALSKSWLRYP